MSGKIPQHFIDDLLARVNIVDVIDSRIKLKRAGKNYSALCPFHKEKSPSFSVSPDKQFYYCFGCGAGGNALGFVMEYEKLNFPEAIEELARTVGVDVPREHDRQRDVAYEKQVKKQFDLLESANAFYQNQLRTHSDKAKAVAYLKERGLSGQIAARFQLGYAPPGWDNLQKHVSKETKDADSLLLKSGMMVENEERGRRYDRFRDRIMFPIRDMRGRTIGFGGRVLADEKPKYLNSPETDTFHKGKELYGLYEARQHTGSLERLLIVEGYMDVVSLAQHGLTWSVATLGTATTEAHLERIFKIVTEVIFCFDGDAAGRQAAKRALDTCVPVMKDGLTARFLFLPDGEDPDTLVRSEGLDAFTERVNESLPFSEYFFKALSDNIDLTSMDGRARFSNQALPQIRSMQTSVLQQMMLDRVAEMTGLTIEQLDTIANLHSKVETIAPTPVARSKPTYQQDLMPDFDSGEYQHPRYFESETSYSDSFSSQSLLTSGAVRPGMSAKINLVNSAISILLHRPDLAHQVVKATELEGLYVENISLLRQLLSYLQTTPDASLGTLLLDWQRDPEMAPNLLMLNEISQVDPVLNNVDAKVLLDDAMSRLLSRKYEHELAELTRLSRERPLTQEEKQQLAQLLVRKAL